MGESLMGAHDEYPDFSQSGEQEAILDWARGLGISWPAGRFLDLGAGDGLSYSNTRALFYEGWGGVCVEPSPGMFDRLSALYAREERVSCVNVAVTAEPDPHLAPFDYARGDHLSTLRGDAQRARWSDVTFERFTVMTCPLASVVEEQVAFVSIDTEGTSVELLAALVDLPAWRWAGCVCVEAEDGADREEIIRLLPGWETLLVTPNNLVLRR